jgi:O-antigen ligase
MVGEQRWLRAYGLVQHPNLLGGCLMVMLLLVAGHYLTTSGWRANLLLAGIGAGLTAILLTYSRSAWLGLALGAAVGGGLVLRAHRMNHLALKRRSVAALAAVALAVVVLFAILRWPLLLSRLGRGAQGVEIRSMEERAMQVSAAWSLIRMRPLLGVGIGNYPTALYELARDAVAAYPVYQPVHNVLLLASAELGVLGGVLWLMLSAAPWLGMLVAGRRLSVSPWWAAGFGALAALALVSFFDFYTWTSHQGRLLVWLCYGLWARQWIRSRPEVCT